MNLEYKIEFIMITDRPEHWELLKRRNIESRTFEPHITFYTEDDIHGISIEEIIKDQRKIGTLFIKVKSEKDREIENAWEGFVDQFRKEQSVFGSGNQITFNVHIIKPLKNISNDSINIPSKYNRYLNENGLYKPDDKQKDITTIWG